MNSQTFFIRQEKEEDYPSVERLIKSAFETEAMNDGGESQLVNHLRKSEAFIPELSLLAQREKDVIGHVLLTLGTLETDQNTSSVLCLAPISVLPIYQKQGIGSQLINAAHKRAKQMGYGAVFLLGHETYYPRFGYQPVATFQIEFPFKAPPENCLVKELEEGFLEGKRGKLHYAKAFY